MPLQDVVLDPSGKFLATLWTARFCKEPDASTCQPGLDRFAVWRFPELERVGTFALRTKGPDAVSLSFNDDGSRMYVVPRMSSSYQAHGLELWDTATWQPIATPEAELSSGVGFTESRDGRHLLLNDVYTQVELYDLSNGERRLKHTFPMSNAPNRMADVVISRDSRYAVVVDPSGPVEVWDLPAAKRRPLTKMKVGGGAAVFLAKTHTFVLTDGDGAVRLWNVQGKVEHTYSGPVGAPAELTDGPLDTVHVIGDDTIMVIGPNCGVRSFPLGGGAPEVIAVAQANDAQGAVCNAALSSDGRSLAFVRRTDEGYRVVHVDVGSKVERPLATVEASWFPYVRWIDRRHIEVAYNSGDTYRSEHYDVTTGKRATPPPQETAPLEVALSIDEGRLSVTRPSDGARVRIALDIDKPVDPRDRDALFGLVR